MVETPKTLGMVADIERLKAKIEAMNELRKVDNERIGRLSEQIGELRTTIFEKEKEIKDLAINASKASDMLTELDPEKMLGNIRKELSKYELLKSRVETNESKYHKLLEEVMALRRKIVVFKDVDEIIKLNEDTKHLLLEMRTGDANIEKNADKVGKMYIQFQKSYNDFENFKNLVGDLKRSFDDTVKEFNDVKARMHLIADLKSGDVNKIEELAALSKEITALKQMVEDLEKNNTKKLMWQPELEEFQEWSKTLDSFMVRKQHNEAIATYNHLVVLSNSLLASPLAYEDKAALHRKMKAYHERLSTMINATFLKK